MGEVNHGSPTTGAGHGVDEMDVTKFLLSLADRHYVTVPKKGQPTVTYNELEVIRLLDISADSLKLQPSLIDVEPPLTVVGDIHGFYRDLLNIFTTLGRPPKTRYLFLGDYVDRGDQSVEAICLLLVYKSLYPTDVYLLRGNHEVARINKGYGFYYHCKTYFGEEGEYEKIYHQFNAVFDLLPISALIAKKVLCMHGGLSPSLQSLEQLRRMPKPIRNPQRGLINDILWSDPEVHIKGWVPSQRMTSFVFGEDVVTNMCKHLNVELIIRAHQVCQDGYRFFADRQLVTIFSAPMYCPVVKNSAAVLQIDENLVISFVFFTPPARRAVKQAE